MKKAEIYIRLLGIAKHIELTPETMEFLLSYSCKDENGYVLVLSNNEIPAVLARRTDLNNDQLQRIWDSGHMRAKQLIMEYCDAVFYEKNKEVISKMHNYEFSPKGIDNIGKFAKIN